MARFLFVVYSAAGHVHPTLPVANALRARGHSVAVLTGPKYEQTIQACDLTYLAPKEWSGTLDRIKPEPPARNARETLYRTREKLRTVFFFDAPQQARDIANALRQWPADVLVSSDMVFGTSLIAERENLLWATHAAFLTCPLPSRDVPPWGMGLAPPHSLGGRIKTKLLSKLVALLTRSAAREWNMIRGAHSLPRQNLPLAASLMSPYLYTLPSVQSFDFPRTDLPPQVHYIGPCLWQEASQEAAAWQPPSDRDQPLIYCTAGTLYNELSFARTAVEAAAGAPFHLLITVGKNNDPLVLGTTPPNVTVTQYVPQHQLLPHVSGVLCTGGSGVVMGSLCAGKPLVIVPQMSDQPENAARCARLGVGDIIDSKSATPARIQAALTRIIQDERYHRASCSFQQELQKHSGPPRAAQLLEQLAAQRAPVLRDLVLHR